MITSVSLTIDVSLQANNQLLIRKTDNFGNIHVYKEWVKSQSKWSEIKCSGQWEFPAPYVVPVTNNTKQLSGVIFDEQTLQHLWHRNVKFVWRPYNFIKVWRFLVNNILYLIILKSEYYILGTKHHISNKPEHTIILLILYNVFNG